MGLGAAARDVVSVTGRVAAGCVTTADGGGGTGCGVGVTGLAAALSTPAAAGLVGGALSNFEIDDDHISGRVANCAYDLKRKPPESDKYKGNISCGGGPSPSSHIAIPPNVRALPALEQATLFAMLLAT